MKKAYRGRPRNDSTALTDAQRAAQIDVPVRTFRSWRHQGEDKHIEAALENLARLLAVDPGNQKVWTAVRVLKG
jgi:hypothetical protein